MGDAWMDDDRRQPSWSWRERGRTAPFSKRTAHDADGTTSFSEARSLMLDFPPSPPHSRRDMAQPSGPQHHYSYAEYLAYERDSTLKHEFYNGEIFAMAGGSRRQNALALRIGGAIDAARDHGCVGFQSDQRVRILATGRSTYPDVSVVCGPIEGDPEDPSGQTLTNPTLLVEVLSPSTEQDDRGSKWQHYQLIPSLREYVLVSQGERRVEHYVRSPSGSWEYTDTTQGTVRLSTGALLDLEKLYDALPN